MTDSVVYPVDDGSLGTRSAGASFLSRPFARACSQAYSRSTLTDVPFILVASRVGLYVSSRLDRLVIEAEEEADNPARLSRR
jgi:hypothetical protein